MFIIVCFVSYMNKTGFGVMLYMYTYLPYVALCVRGERGERGVTLPPIIVMRLSEMYRHNKKIIKNICMDYAYFSYYCSVNSDKVQLSSS